MLLDKIRERADRVRHWWLARGYRLPGGYRRIYHYHIRKTAGTSVNFMFYGLRGEKPYDVHQRMVDSRGRYTVSGGLIFNAWRPDLAQRGHYFYASSHAPAYNLALPTDTFTLTCFRDPQKRLISFYKMLAAYRRDNVQHPVMGQYGHHLQGGFASFVRTLPAERINDLTAMFSPTLDPDEAFERVAACSCILFVEDLEAGVAELAHTLDLPLQFRHSRRSRYEFTEGTDEALSILQDRQAPDRELYARVKAAYG
ncbi:MAG: sulfotransferase family protein [Chloroflexi bacterium]|nr:sulfotransferase family protein [Chloroflexota bacterium]